ncbi:M13 family metallopeptidase [Spirosoma endophyticum]|uniref:Endothelin-converting enzyme Metallo peptidase. MEROPS family M13 n=1 Tax=Spirosoma endophyticum TaxID=662367 RepID=A0A1I1FM14_9BACT|nr:M13 family metallopeptidase [Spirosoma endophyticum]SFC00374.1 endothelin-converting enzyme Metallo peptidase. MEROPS family M13 [Spirosoma endophyticum]
MNKQLTFLSAVMLMAGLMAATPPGKSGKRLLQPNAPKIPFIDRQNMNLAVKPGDDFYQYANGEWLKKNPVPASKTRWGSFNILNEKSLDAMKSLLEDAAKNTKKGRLYQMVGDFYASGMDSTGIEQKGFDPIKADLARVEQVKSRADLMNEIAYQRAQGSTMFFSLFVAQDRRNVNKNVLQFVQGGTTLPDRDYYLKNDARSQKIREAYRDNLSKMFALIGEEPSRAATSVDAILTLETALANAQMTRVESRDPIKTYNKLTVADFTKQTPGINWANWMPKLGIRGQDTVLVQSPSFYHSMDSLLTATPVEDLKTYMRWNLLKNAAPYLSNAFVNQNFAFNKVLSGQKELTPRWQRSSNLINGSLGELLGQLYVQQYFKPEAKQRILVLIDNLEASFNEHINAVDWMSVDTKKRALTKLTSFKRKIGYPDKWKNYEGVTIRRDDFYGNVVATNKWWYTDNVSRLGKPVDKTEWLMTPQTVNAYYMPVNNEIAFPAAILQFPFFDAEADDAVNYAAIGAVIGHEMTHGFDDQGRQYDADGTLRDWWTKDDATNFKQRADKVKEQYFGFKVLDSLKVNGQLTLGENLADLGGLAIAYDAFKKTSQGQGNADIDGFTPDQRFFLSWAQVWRANTLPESQAQNILTDPHAPEQYRCNGPLTNIDAWYKAFNVQPGEKMYKTPDQRFKVW